MLEVIVLTLVILLLIGALPAWPRGRWWSYFPGGGLKWLTMMMLLLLLVGRV
ncbi:MAG: DUF3309 family protein [Chloroflexi bacterium]|nr:DUF3309 family protein [Chloroflexota bacterium]